VNRVIGYVRVMGMVRVYIYSISACLLLLMGVFLYGPFFGSVCGLTLNLFTDGKSET
jgi:hypothetical protein